MRRRIHFLQQSQSHHIPAGPHHSLQDLPRHDQNPVPTKKKIQGQLPSTFTVQSHYVEDFSVLKKKNQSQLPSTFTVQSHYLLAEFLQCSS
jgi:hypothetical protein